MQRKGKYTYQRVTWVQLQQPQRERQFDGSSDNSDDYAKKNNITNACK